MKKFLSLILILLLSASVMVLSVGCGDDAEVNSSDSSDSNDSDNSADDDDSDNGEVADDDSPDVTDDDDDAADDDDDTPDYGPDAIILDDGVSGTYLVDILAQYGIDAEIWGLESDYNGEELEADVVLLLDGGPSVWGIDMPEQGQQALVDLVSQGGSLMITEWVLWDVQYGHYNILKELVPVSYKGWGSGEESFHVLKAEHPIARSIDDFTVTEIAYSVVEAKRGIVVLSGDHSRDAVVADSTTGGRVVYCSFAAMSDGMAGTLDPWTQPMKQLMENILSWLMG